MSDRENTDNQRETLLQAYIDNMSELLLEKKLRDSAEDDEVRTIARVRTLTVLSRLDANRKASVLQLLYKSDLLAKSKPIIDLKSADLSRANLSGTYLREARLSEVNLNGANLEKADLNKASLPLADLSGANLEKADLNEAILKGATGMTIGELEKQARSLQSTTMPDGSKHP